MTMQASRHSQGVSTRHAGHALLESPAPALSVIWVASAVISVFAPYLVNRL